MPCYDVLYRTWHPVAVYIKAMTLYTGKSRVRDRQSMLVNLVPQTFGRGFSDSSSLEVIRQRGILDLSGMKLLGSDFIGGLDLKKLLQHTPFSKVERRWVSAAVMAPPFQMNMQHGLGSMHEISFHEFDRVTELPISAYASHLQYTTTSDRLFLVVEVHILLTLEDTKKLITCADEEKASFAVPSAVKSESESRPRKYRKVIFTEKQACAPAEAGNDVCNPDIIPCALKRLRPA